MKLTFFRNGKLRWKYSGSGKLLTSPRVTDDGEEPCCCGTCSPESLIGTTLYFEACHGCERARFSVYVSEYYVKDINLNTSFNNGGCGRGTAREQVTLTQEILDNIEIEKEDKDGQICCVLYVRLGCQFSANSPPGPCHSDVAVCEAFDPDGNQVLDGVIGERQTKLLICPSSSSSSSGGSVSSFRAAPYRIQQPEPAPETAWLRIHDMPESHDNVGSALRTLLLNRFFGGDVDVSLPDGIIAHIAEIDKKSCEWCEYHTHTLVWHLQSVADLFNMPYDMRAAHVFIKKAIRQVKQNRKTDG